MFPRLPHFVSPGFLKIDGAKKIHVTKGRIENGTGGRMQLSSVAFGDVEITDSRIHIIEKGRGVENRNEWVFALNGSEICLRSNILSSG